MKHHNLKICVYAISKNEEKFVNRWYESMKEADEIYVLDTGSTDNTLNLLKEKNIHIEQKIITPWRFDIARNYSLNMLPEDTDICVCTDLDEVFQPGWRKELEKNWKQNTTRARYNYNWQLDKNNNPVINFYLDKIHTRKNYHWIHPVHEVLKYEQDQENIITINTITLNHYPDTKKSRKSYLPLLELAVQENPQDDRNTHYLGREYMYYKQWDKSIKTLKKHLKLKTSTWKDERSASMRFISRCYKNKKDFRKAKTWLTKAIKEAPYLRDAYMEKAILEYELKNYNNTIKYCLKALNIKYNPKTYINEYFTTNEYIYDLLSISYYYQKNYLHALYFIDQALEINPNNKRLQNNKIFFKQKESN